MVSNIKKIELSVLKQIILPDFHNGLLSWKARPISMFSDSRHGQSAESYQRMWNKKFAGKPALNTKDANGYMKGAIFNRGYYAHRVIFALYHGYWADEIDHDDQSKANNSIKNLLDRSHSENMQNTKIMSHNTSGQMGVSKIKGQDKYRAYIYDCGKQKHLGRFSEIQGAIDARKLAETELGYNVNHGAM